MFVYICLSGRVLLCVGAGRRSRSACLMSITLFTRCDRPVDRSRRPPACTRSPQRSPRACGDVVQTSWKLNQSYSYLLTWFYTEEVRFHSHSRTSRHADFHTSVRAALTVAPLRHPSLAPTPLHSAAVAAPRPEPLWLAHARCPVPSTAATAAANDSTTSNSRLQLPPTIAQQAMATAVAENASTMGDGGCGCHQRQCDG